MKLQKLLFFAHGWHLAINDEPLLNERIEAWEYGPVVSSVYGEFRDFGIRSIDRPARTVDFQELTFKKIPAPTDENAVAFLQTIWDAYKDFSAVQLSNMTHQPGTPWRKIYDEATKDGRSLPRHLDIPDEIILDYFKRQLTSEIS